MRMKTSYLSFSVIITFLALEGCGGETRSEAPPARADLGSGQVRLDAGGASASPDAGGTDSGDVPQFYDSYEDMELGGVDVDDDGLRDDIQLWLQDELFGQERRRAEAYARSFQKVLTLPPSTEDAELQSLFSAMRRAGHCLRSVMGPEESVFTRDLFSRTFNNGRRYRAYINRELRGVPNPIAEIPTTDALASFCNSN